MCILLGSLKCVLDRQQTRSYPIVHIAVGEHGIEVLYTLKCLPVVFVLKTLLNSAQVHRLCYDCVIILKNNKNTDMNKPKSLHSRSQSDGVPLQRPTLGWSTKILTHTFRAIPAPTYWETQCNCINWLAKRPREVMPPQSFDHHLLQVLQLIGHSSGTFGIEDLRRRGVSARSGTDFHISHRAFPEAIDWTVGRILCCNLSVHHTVSWTKAVKSPRGISSDVD